MMYDLVLITLNWLFKNLGRHRGLLVETELPHDPVHVVLLDVDVVKDRLLVI